MTTFNFDADGRMAFIYDDAGAGVAREVGTLDIRRASHVEPTLDGGWVADMSPVEGPLLGPYMTRAEALEREVEWLTQAGIPFPSDR